MLRIDRLRAMTSCASLLCDRARCGTEGMDSCAFRLDSWAARMLSMDRFVSRVRFDELMSKDLLESRERFDCMLSMERFDSRDLLTCSMLGRDDLEECETELAADRGVWDLSGAAVLAESKKPVRWLVSGDVGSESREEASVETPRELLEVELRSDSSECEVEWDPAEAWRMAAISMPAISGAL